MKRKLASLLTLAFLLTTIVAASTPTSNRTKTEINIGWKYHRGDVTAGAHSIDFDDQSWDTANLPHTYQLTSLNLDDSKDDKYQETYHRDVSWYRRDLEIEANPTQKIFLEFEGAHQKTELWVNGQYVGEHAISPYTPFHFDITKFVIPGQTNSIALKLDNRKSNDIPPDGHSLDFVLFGGLYRDVYLVITDSLHFTFPWEEREAGIFVTTPSVSKQDATISVRSTVRNELTEDSEATLLTRVLNKENRVILTLETSAIIRAGSTHTFLQTGGIDQNVHLWSLDSPYLYRVNSQLIKNKTVVDMQENPLGLRWFEHQLGKGVLLNGEPIELIGANRHQHFPYIGDAVPNNLHRLDAIKIKESGMNIVRLAHYPHDNSFIQACDELGILITEEPPTWIEFGNEIWMDRLEQSLRRMIRNHRNHPSIWGWGAGINHRGPVKRLHYAAKEEDPTRVTMNNGTTWTGPQRSGVTDIYSVMDYTGAVCPEGEFMFAMEHTGTVDTSLHQELVSQYKGDPNRIGLTLWSGHHSSSFIKRGKTMENLAEWRASCWDAFRIRMPAFYWYQSELTSDPMVHIPDERAQTEGKIRVFTNCDEIELLHDGETIARHGPTIAETNKYLNAPSIDFDYDWHEGSLTAVGYSNNREMARHTRVKAGAPHHIELTIDDSGYNYQADAASILIAYATIKDKNGNTVESDTPNVTFEVSGHAEIVGDSSIQANPISWKLGVAPALIRVSGTPGNIKVSAHADNLISDELSFETHAFTPNIVKRNTKPIYDLIELKIDIGNPLQHIEDEWQAWSDNKIPEVSQTFRSSNGTELSVKLSTNANRLKWSNAWGIPGDLCFLIEDGVSVSAGEKIVLTFQDLPEGQYTLKTWHHALAKKRGSVPALDFTLDNGSFKETLEDFKPSFGEKIKVSTAGAGARGDGGSYLGANGHATFEFSTIENRQVTLEIGTDSVEGKINLNGFQLLQAID